VAALTWHGPAARAVFIDVRDETWALALACVVDRSGRRRSVHGDGPVWTITDHPETRRVADVLVCGPSAVDAAAAVAAFAAGQARSVVSADDPDQVAAALDGLDTGLSLVAADLIERAKAVPALTPRQRTVLEAVLAGQTNAAIAAALQVRPVTIKREVASLFGTFDVTRRFELMSRGFALGYRPRPARP
jgi:DNA-binding NarL/FixJ family response regulator